MRVLSLGKVVARLQWAAAAVGAAMLWSAAPAAALVIDVSAYETPGATTFMPFEWEASGFRFRNGGTFVVSDSVTDPQQQLASPGADMIAMFLHPAFDPLEMTEVGGGAFNLSSLELSHWTTYPGVHSYTVTGLFADSSTLTLTGTVGPGEFDTLAPGWTNLVKLTFAGVPNGGEPSSAGFIGFSRITVSDYQPHAPVPEPATWALMILGFGAAGAALRRRACGAKFVARRLRAKAIAGALIAISAANPAGAAIVVATYTGVASPGAFDVSGVFGPAGRALDGLGVVARFTFDSEVGNLYPGANANVLEGFDLFGANPMLSATLTIDGRSLDVRPYGTFGDVQQYNDFAPGLDQVVHRAIGLGTLTATVANDFAPVDFLDTADFSAALDYAVPPGVRGEGFFDFALVDGGGAVQEARGSFAVSRVTIASLAVPEPATWAMMILGFGLAGSAVRRRRSPAAGLRV